MVKIKGQILIVKEKGLKNEFMVFGLTTEVMLLPLAEKWNISGGIGLGWGCKEVQFEQVKLEIPITQPTGNFKKFVIQVFIPVEMSKLERMLWIISI